MFDWPAAISRYVWDTKYRHDGAEPPERSPEDSWRRVARALASVETDRAGWAERFHAAMSGFRFLPAGRILAGAGTGREVTLFNCFVMGTLEDSVSGIFGALEESAVTLQQGGGIGIDFSPLRPRGMPAHRTGNTATGPVSFMEVWDAMCATIRATGGRRGAMMATLRCDHPDIEEFVEAKRTGGRLTHFNLSVLVSDAFMQAVRTDDVWPLVFPGGRTGSPVRTIRARALWDRIARAAHDGAEPGVLFVDRINRFNNLAWCETITATNPCGEVPLPPHGACDLGSINLMRFVRAPFTPQARLDTDAIEAIVPVAVRMLDNVIDLSRFPLEAQAETARRTRRIGLGITGLADALFMLGLDYGSEAARDVAGGIMRTVCHAAYRASVALAPGEGALPPVRPRGLSGGRVRIRPARRHPRCHRRARHPQQPSHRDRADRQYQPACRECVERAGTGLRRAAPSPGHRYVRQSRHPGTHRSGPRPLAANGRAEGRPPWPFRHRRGAPRRGPSRHAGRPSTACRQRHLQDREPTRGLHAGGHPPAVRTGPMPSA